MNILVDLLPEAVEIGGQEYEINTDFRIGIIFEALIQDETLLAEEKTYATLNLFFNCIPHNVEEAIEKIKWFYIQGKEENKKEANSGAENNNNKHKKIFSFEEDAGYIYSAFLSQYGIDLQDTEHLHWWKFKTLFESLKDDNKIVKIMGYRSVEITNDMSDSDKKFYRKMKETFALPDMRSTEEKEEDFHEAMASLI